MKKILFIMLFLSVFNAQAQNGKASGDGFIFFAGAGNMSGGLGITAQYQFRLGLFNFFTPYVGTGIEFGSRDIEAALHGYSAGACLEHGKYHRVFGGIIYGSRGVGYENKESVLVNKHILVGPSLILGYKTIFRTGIVFSLNVGMAFLKNPVAINKKYYKAPTAGIGIGYKF